MSKFPKAPRFTEDTPLQSKIPVPKRHPHTTPTPHHYQSYTPQTPSEAKSERPSNSSAGHTPHPNKKNTLGKNKAVWKYISVLREKITLRERLAELDIIEGDLEWIVMEMEMEMDDV